MKYFEGLLSGIIITTLVTGLIITVSAQSDLLEVSFNDDLKLYVNMEKIDPVDANGNKVDMFIYNGTTYLPIRSVASALDLKVGWYENTSSIYLGKQPGAKTKLTLNDFKNNDTENVIMELVKGNNYNKVFTYSMDSNILKDANNYQPSLGLYGSQYYSNDNDILTSTDWCTRINFNNLSGYKAFSAKYKVFIKDNNIIKRPTRLVALDQNGKMLFEQAIDSDNIYKDINFDISGATQVSIRVTTPIGSSLSSSGVLADLTIE